MTLNNMRSDFMAHALQLANKGRYSTSPNPMVGCVIVRDDVVIAEGWHQQAGSEHAEIVALNNTSATVAGATLYVTLEPCCHYGRTSPCTNAIINANLKKVVIGCLDTNPQVAGNGVAALQAAGIDVSVGMLQEECQQLNRYFFHAMQHNKPYVIAKWAMSIDGKIASKTHDAKWISNAQSRLAVHELRHQVDAILVGAGTVIADDPKLTVRKTDTEIEATEQPLRIILDGKTTLPKNSKLFSNNLPGKTILASSLIGHKNYDIPQLLAALNQQQIRSVLVEGGMHVLTAFFDNYAVDEIQCYIAPKLIGGTQALTPYMGEGIAQVMDAQCFSLHSCTQFADDVLLTYRKKGNKCLVE